LNCIAEVTGMPGLDSTKGKTDMYRIRRVGLASEPVWLKQHICGIESLKRKILGLV